MSSIVKDKKTYYVLGILFIFVLWILGNAYFQNDYIVPSLEKTFSSLFKLLSEADTYFILGNTLLRLVIAIGACFILGVFLAGLSKMSYQFKAFIKPGMVLMKTLPIAVLIILLIVMFSSNALYYIVGVVILPIIYEATINGLDSIDKNIVDEVKMLSETNFTIIKNIYLPLTAPYVLTSLIQSFGLGLKVLVMAEFISNTNNSIGFEIILYKDYYNEMSYVYAWSIILIVFVLSVDLLINYIYKKRSLV